MRMQSCNALQQAKWKNPSKLEDEAREITLLQRYLTAIRTYFTRWLIRTNSYDLTRTI